MKRIFSVLFAMAAVAALVVWAPTMKHGSIALPDVHAQSGCSAATLTGNYAFTDSGFAAPRGRGIAPEVPVAALGVLKFDGAGNVSFGSALAFNGTIIPNSETGTYTMNSDCTGSISLTAGDIFPLDFNMVIIGGGTEVFGLLTDPGNTQTFDAKKQ